MRIISGRVEALERERAEHAGGRETDRWVN